MAKAISVSKKTRCFLKGYYSIFDISGKVFITKNNNYLSGFRKDYLAMRRDWQNLGYDMRNAIKKVMIETIDQKNALNQRPHVRQP